MEDKKVLTAEEYIQELVKSGRARAARKKAREDEVCNTRGGLERFIKDRSRY